MSWTHILLTCDPAISKNDSILEIFPLNIAQDGSDISSFVRQSWETKRIYNVELASGMQLIFLTFDEITEMCYFFGQDMEELIEKSDSDSTR